MLNATVLVGANRLEQTVVDILYLLQVEDSV